MFIKLFMGKVIPMAYSVNICMNTNDAIIIKTLAELGLRNEPQLTPEQEKLLQQALDPHEQYLEDILKIFNSTENT